MIIDGRDYHFAYTVGAYLDVAELKLPAPKSKAENDKLYIYTAVAMNKGYEDRLKLADPEYKPNYLTLAQVRAMDYFQLGLLIAEVDRAYREGSKVTVKTQPKKAPKSKNLESTVEEKPA